MPSDAESEPDSDDDGADDDDVAHDDATAIRADSDDDGVPPVPNTTTNAPPPTPDAPPPMPDVAAASAPSSCVGGSDHAVDGRNETSQAPPPDATTKTMNQTTTPNKTTTTANDAAMPAADETNDERHGRGSAPAPPDMSSQRSETSVLSSQMARMCHSQPEDTTEATCEMEASTADSAETYDEEAEAAARADPQRPPSATPEYTDHTDIPCAQNPNPSGATKEESTATQQSECSVNLPDDFARKMRVLASPAHSDSQGSAETASTHASQVNYSQESNESCVSLHSAKRRSPDHEVDLHEPVAPLRPREREMETPVVPKKNAHPTPSNYGRR